MNKTGIFGQSKWATGIASIITQRCDTAGIINLFPLILDNLSWSILIDNLRWCLLRVFHLRNVSLVPDLLFFLGFLVLVLTLAIENSSVSFHFGVKFLLVEHVDVICQLKAVGFLFPGLNIWKMKDKLALLTSFDSSESFFHSAPIILEISVSEVAK